MEGQRREEHLGRRLRVGQAVALQNGQWKVFRSVLAVMLLTLFWCGSAGAGRSFIHGTSEIESCSVQIHSSSSSSQSSNPSSPFVSSLRSGDGGGGGVGGSSSSDSGSLNGASVSGGNSGGSSSFLSSSSGGGGVGGEHSVVLCQIRTLHPDLDMENLTASITGNSQLFDVSSITRLKLVCNDLLFFESVVHPGQLSSLSELHELTIDKCKLKHLPSEFLSGLRHLRKLAINTGNSEWAARSLEISPGALGDVPQLRHLHLGFNHMWNLPERLLCQVGSLQTLNLTHNLLSDIDDLGLPGKPLLAGHSTKTSEFLSSSDYPSASSSCLADLRSFDLSYNSLRTLGSGRLERMRRLQEFRADHNWLEELEDEAFHGLGQLRLLNLSSNRLVAVPPKLFQPCKLLRELDLRNNSLTALSPGLLNGLEHLQILDLSMNSLSSQWITSEAFKSLVRLIILNLSHNQLTHLTPATFQDLYSLQVLDLGNNLISSIDDGTFAPMSNLHSLNLGRNRLVSINANMFNGLYVLHKLILDYNQLSAIEPGAMKNCTSLQDLGLVGNQLTEVPEALRGLQLLRTLDLGENRISLLNNETFHGMGQLYGLRLVDNHLEDIPKGLCDPINRLRVFNVAQNKINKVSSSAFNSCPELRVLRLDSNHLDTLPSSLSPQLPNLLWLNVSENKIHWVDYSLLPTTLEWFDVSHNQLESLGGAWANVQPANTNSNANSNSPSSASQRLEIQLPIQNQRLRVVDASHNQLKQLDYHAVPPSLEILRLSHNHLKKIAEETFRHSAHLRRVELIGNQLENIPLNALRLPTIPAGRPLPEFFLGGNPFLCDCEMEWLRRINQLSAIRSHPTVLDLDAIVCRLAFSRTVTHIPLPDIKPQDFLCPYKSHCFALCHCCEFDACDCEMTCPGNCTCYHGDTWKANVVNCASSGLLAIPGKFPMDSTQVYLDGNSIPVLKSHTFIGRKNLRLLYLNASQIETISNKSFNGLQSLESLHLEENRLKVLYGYEFDHLTKLRELYLHDNLIETISNTTFLPLKALETLRLDGNRLVVFAVWQLSLNPYLVDIGLARNQWNCDCQFLHQLYGWVTDNSRKVVDIGQLQCVWNTTHKPGPHLMDYNRTCGSSWALMGIEGGFDLTAVSALPLLMGFIGLAILLILVIVLVVICRENARIWLYSHFGVRMCPAEVEDDKSYDAYLLYSQKDEEFVAQRIADELETNDNYRLCLHYRDLISETGDLKEMMIGAVENSKSVVIILSRNFLQGEWTSGEYRGAFHAVLKKSSSKSHHSSSSGGTSNKSVVIVFIEDIPPIEINPDIRSWMRHNKIDSIKWSVMSTDSRKNRRFWSKLKYCLPDPSSHYHSNITSNTTTTSASSGETHPAMMSTLKYSTVGGGMLPESEQHHILEELNRDMNNANNMNLNMNNKLWPYAANFVALPPKYQTSGQHTPSSTMQSPQHSHLYYPPLPTTNPPKSPPSSHSTESTTADEVIPGFFTSKSPVPVPKSSYRNNNISNSTLPNGAVNGGGGGGESYLSLEGEHVYSTLDPPSPQPQIQLQQNNILNNIHLPNGYTYQPQLTMTMNGQGQWHPSNNHHTHHQQQQQQQQQQPKSLSNSKNYKHKDPNPVQTYLV